MEASLTLGDIVRYREKWDCSVTVTGIAVSCFVLQLGLGYRPVVICTTMRATLRSVRVSSRRPVTTIELALAFGGQRVSEAKPDLSRLGELAGGLGLHEHLCLIYETQEEQFASALPYLRSGLERRERCLYIADENSGTAVLDALRKEGTDVDRHLRSGALILAGKQETYLKHGRFDPDWWIRFLSQDNP